MVTAVSWGYNRARVWLGELPEWCGGYTPTTIAGRQFAAGVSSVTRERRAAVECLVAGPRASYGALGATFVPDTAGALILQIPYSDGIGDLLTGSLAERIDTVHVGLASEYVSAFLESTLLPDAALMLGSGTLRYSCAAHGEVGSSEMFFEVLGRVVMRLLSLQDMSTSEADLVLLLQQEVRRKNSGQQANG
jgi:hypothetical protein